MSIALDRASTPPAFDVLLDLSDYAFPSDAEVVVEAAADWTVMRFQFGTIGEPPEAMHGALSELESPEGVRFAVKVLGTGEAAGLILGEASGIVPSDQETERTARSFVDVRPESLDHVAWKLIFDETHPILVVNTLVGDWKGFVRTPEFRSLVVPEVFRRMLEEAASEDSDFDGDAPPRTWEAQCLQLAAQYSHQQLPPPADPDRQQEWIDDAVAAFARHHRLGGALRETFESDVDR